MINEHDTVLIPEVMGLSGINILFDDTVVCESSLGACSCCCLTCASCSAAACSSPLEESDL